MRERARVAPWAGLAVSVDVLMACLLSVGALLDVRGLPPGRPVLAAAALALAATLPVSTRRRHPVGSALAALGGTAAYQLLARDPQFTFEPYAVLMTVYSVGSSELRGRTRWHRGVLLLAVPAFALVAIASGQGVGLAVGGWLLFAAAPYAVGVLVERRTRTVRRLESEIRGLVGERQLRERTAAAGERLRVARELHDVVARCLTEMVIQAGAARSVAPTDRDGAMAALRAVLTSGRTAMAELARLVANDPTREPAAEPRLLGLVRGLGADVTTSVVGVGGSHPLPATVDAVAFRVVQEALTNTARHAPGAPVSVSLRADTHALELRVVNGPGMALRSRLPRSGFGLMGMRERVQASGGRLWVGPTGAGGYEVRATMPIDQVAAEPQDDRNSRFGRLRHRIARVADLAVPVAWLTVLETDALTSTHRQGPLLLNLAAVGAMAVAAAWRRPAPIGFLFVVGGLALCLSGGLTSRDHASLVGLYSLVVPVYAVTRWARRGRVAALVTWALVATLAGLVEGADLGGLVGPLMAATAVAAVGALARSQRELAARLADTRAAAAEEVRELQRLATQRERTRLAEQLHAPVAGIVTRMMLAAEEALRLLASGDPARDEAISRIEQDGREALVRMREILGALRAGPRVVEAPLPRTEPVPGLEMPCVPA